MSEIIYSVVIPAYNEERSIRQLYKEIKSVMENIGPYEVLFIDDGSTDNTKQLLNELEKENKDIKYFSFQKNFGKAAAYAAGFDNAKGDIIITLDGDLQDNPKDIPALLEKLKKSDLVVGWKYRKKTDMCRKLASRIFNLLNLIFFGIKLHDINSGFRVMKKEVTENLELSDGFYRYIPVIAFKKGYRVSEVKVNNRKRLFGKSKYTTKRLVTGLLDLVMLRLRMSHLKIMKKRK